jgi:hypothetical protein
MLKKVLVATLLIVICSQNFYSQGFYSSRLWKNQRHEITGYFGASQFLGELGGLDKVGTDFLWDMEFSETKFAGGISYMFYTGERHGLRFQAGIQRVSGNDNLTTEIFRQNRNIHFRSNIYEFSMNYEFHFIKEKFGNVYNLKSSLGKKLGLKKLNIGMYGFVGVGGFYFNPQAQNPNTGLWVDLAPLNTEGQGLLGGPEDYKQISVNIPVGLGFRYAVSKQIGIKLELSHRFTFTDYIDDVSGVYYDQGAVASATGSEAGYFANPTSGLIPAIWDGVHEINPTKAGSQRGDPTDRDGYLYAVLGIYYKPKATSKGRYKGGSKRRIKASF